MGLIIISLADKPDIQNISIPAKKLKVFLTQYWVSFFTKKLLNAEKQTVRNYKNKNAD